MVLTFGVWADGGELCDSSQFTTVSVSLYRLRLDCLLLYRLRLCRFPVSGGVRWRIGMLRLQILQSSREKMSDF